MARRHSKTRAMRECEERHGEPLETLLRRLYDQGHTKSEIAQYLDIGRSTLDLWLMNLGARYSIEFETEPVG